MGMVEIKKGNMQLIFDSITDGYRTLTEISKNTGISKMTVCELTQQLIENKIITKHTEPENKRGRRSNIYSPNSKMHSMYIEETELNFSCISINTEGKVVQRMIYEKRDGIPIEDAVYQLFCELRRTRAFGRFCTCIYLVCEDSSLKYFPNDIIKTTKEEFILNSISDSRKIYLFEIENRIIISAYGHLHYPDKSFSIDEIKKILNVDKVFIYNDDIYFGIFDALQMSTLKNLKMQINNI